MYRHLLVPIDSTDLSIEVVGNAVGLASALRARVTFVHATPSDTSQRLEVLAKAEAAARACGVPYSSKHVVSDRPAAAIAETAQAIGCDLVFMATHRQLPGAPPPSTTVDVVLNAGVPVLVSCGSGASVPSAHAVAIFRDEHRALGTVLHAGMQALAAARNEGRAADARLMRAIVRYLEVFQLGGHRRIEEEQLFGRLRQRTATLDAELDELLRQHARERQRVAALSRRVDILSIVGNDAAVSATRDFDDAFRSHAAFVWEHLGREEGVILPAAQRLLSEADWAAIDAAITNISEPITDSSEASEAQRLFSFIVDAAGGLPQSSPA